MRLRTISIFRGLQVYVLSTSKPLPKGSRTIGIATVRDHLYPLKNTTDEGLVNNKISL